MSQVQKSIMLRLRNNETRIADPNDESSHASYQTTLKTPVTLEEGDTVRVHTCILDTSAESVIQVDEPNGIECRMGIFKYLTYYQDFKSGIDGKTAAQVIKPQITVDPTPPATKPVKGSNQIPDVKKYFAALQKGSIAGSYYLQTVTILPLHQGLDKCGNCILKFRYTNGVTGAKSTYPLEIPPFHPVSHENGLSLTLNILVVGNKGWDDFAPEDDKEFYTNHKLLVPSNAADKARGTGATIFYGPEIPAGKLVSTPFIEELDFQIPNGRYTPGEISTIINNKISDLEFYGPSINEPSLTPPQFCVNNPFLSTLRQMSNNAQNNFIGSPYQLVFYPEVAPSEDISGNLREDVGREMTIDPTVYEANQLSALGYGAPPLNRDDLFIGAEQVDLNFDPVLKKLNFSIMHFPIYVGFEEGGGATAVPGVQYNADGKLATVYGGAAIATLSPSEFWQKQLGFVTITTPFQQQQTSFNTGDNGVGGDDVFPIKVATTVGRNVTGIFKGLDIPVPKTDRFFAPEATKGGAVETSITQGIIADREFDVSEKDEGYFLIEVGFKFPQTMIGGQYGSNLTNNNIQSVVGKYFTGANSFLQDTGAGSIVYEHHGEPELLTDLNVRILLPDGSIPSDTELGPKNSIFLEIIKTETIEPPSPIAKAK